MKRRWLPAVVLAAVLLTACAPAQERFSVAPKGGYVETKIDLGEIPHDHIFPHGDGSLDAIGNGQGRRVSHFYSPDGGETWQERDTEGWMRRIAALLGKNLEGKSPSAGKAVDLLEVEMDEARNLYCILRDDRGEYRLMRVSPEGEAAEITIPEWRSGIINDERFGLRGLHVDGDTVSLAFADHVVRYNGEGLDNRVSSWLDMGEEVRQAEFSRDGTVIWTGAELVFTDAAEGKEIRRVEFPDWRGSRASYAFTMDEQGAVYTASASGVQRLAPGGATFETVLDGARYSFGGENCEVSALLYRADTDTFYVGYRENGPEVDGVTEYTTNLCRYTYDPDLPFPEEGETADTKGIDHADTDD